MCRVPLTAHGLTSVLVACFCGVLASASFAQQEVEDTFDFTLWDDAPQVAYARAAVAGGGQPEDDSLDEDFSLDLVSSNEWEYKIKISPFASPNPSRKEDLFTADGDLKERPKTNLEYKLLLNKERNRFFSRNIHRIKNLTKIRDK